MGFSEEFAGLWKYISDWQNVFRHFDRDRSGSIEGAELAEALRSFGYNLSPPLLALIEHKYGKQNRLPDPTHNGSLNRKQLQSPPPDMALHLGSRSIALYGHVLQ
jgi:Ca2+-binding EF-hand superfamily protein